MHEEEVKVLWTTSSVILKQELPCGVALYKSLIVPESQKATCTGFNSSELEYPRLLYTYRFALLNKAEQHNTVYYHLQNDRY